MAEALISMLIENLGSMAFNQIGEELKLLKDVKVNVSGIKRKLGIIQVVLEDAERKQLTDDLVRLWLEELKDISHDMDQLLDEWNTAMIASQDHDQNKVCCPFVSSPLSCFKSKVKKLTLHHDIGHKIKELNQKLDVIASEKDKFSLIHITVAQPVQGPTTTSFVEETYGRNEDREILVSRLLSDNDGAFEIIPIVGMGGLGKTTLAQLAFNDPKVNARFDKRVWVCVSDPFDLIKVAKAIVGSFEGEEPHISELDNLLQRLRVCVEGKRFLLVLDDVWTEDSGKWEQLKLPLSSGAVGSRVIVTTRKHEVAIMMGAMNRAISLEGLSEENCWLILKRWAFPERSEEESKEFEGVGREITKKCKGLPLVAKILGGHLLTKKTKAQWEGVRDSELWELSGAKEKIFAPFLLSYYDLPATEKRCFSYCALFPKDHLIDRDQLICMWMSQNYLSHKKNPEEFGRECFENLAMRSFFQNFEKRGYDGSITHCKMHDIVHDFSQFLMGNECVTMEFNNVEEIVMKPLDERVRHLTIVSECEIETMDFNTISDANKRNLRALFAVVKLRENSHYSSFFLQLTYLRSLTLSGCSVSHLPDSIGKLIYLRYFDISNNPFRELPNTLSDQCNLRSLNLLQCNQLQRLPEGIGRLLNLRHLYVGSYNNQISRYPKSFGDLASLRSLDMLCLGKDDEEYFNIGDLKKLRNLQFKGSLFIRGCRNLQSGNEAEKVGLKNTPQLNDLVLDFERTENSLGMDQDDGEILEGLEPHQNLRCLDIFNFMGSKLSPNWMASLINLREIKLVECRNCKIFPSLGKLPSLESIWLQGLWSVENVGAEFVGVAEEGDTAPTSSTITLFPKLNKLRFFVMPKWEKWEGRWSRSIRIMPCLTLLQFVYCPRLRVLPDFLKMNTSLQQVEINGCAIMQKWCQQKTGEEWAKISDSPNIALNNNYVKRDGEWIKKDTSHCNKCRNRL